HPGRERAPAGAGARRQFSSAARGCSGSEGRGARGATGGGAVPLLHLEEAADGEADGRQGGDEDAVGAVDDVRRVLADDQLEDDEHGGVGADAELYLAERGRHVREIHDCELVCVYHSCGAAAELYTARVL